MMGARRAAVRYIEPARMGKMQIPTKPAGDSDLKPATIPT
jgi:hypothetical protein